MEIFSFSHQGKKPFQEDEIVILNGKNLYAVCDGVGGLSNGRFASALIKKFLIAHGEQYKSDLSSLISDMIKYMETMSIEENILTEFASTIVLCFISENVLYATYLGDSKLIYISNKSPEKNYITKDHSFIEELSQSGFLDTALIQKHPFRNMITRYVSNQMKAKSDDFDIFKISDLQSGDLIILCTDGVIEQFSEEAIIQHFSGNDLNLLDRWHVFKDTCNNNCIDNNSCILIRL